MTEMNRRHTAPVKVPRSRRNHDLAVLTSFQPGKFVPVAAIPLLREDALNATVNVAVEMMETTELLMNPVNIRLRAYVVPLLAMARFDGSRDQFDRSYAGQPAIDGGAVVPFIETAAYGTFGANEVYKALGLHALSATLVNTAYLETYNTVWNFLANNRSPEITERARLATTLAPAFWAHSRFEHVVPDFDQAVLDGEVALNLVNNRLDVHGIGFVNKHATAAIDLPVSETASGSVLYPNGYRVASFQEAVAAGQAQMGVNFDVANNIPDIWAELESNGVTISLANLELAKKTQAFAAIRAKYEQIDDEYIIDMLMDGLSIPDQALKQPILLADKTVRISQAKRYATDAANLASSAVSGGAMLSLKVRVPKLSVGGVVMVFAEAVPEQLFERQQDPFFHSTSVAAWPEFLRDYLDPEKVDVVTNGQIDVNHATPTLTFGYEPMNAKWTAWGPRVGGKFMRPVTNTGTDTVRKRLWSAEMLNPILSTDFYLTTTMHNKPFLDIVSDPFELTLIGNAVIEGNTQFGGMLIEATSNYDDVMAKAPVDRIVKA